MPLSLYFHIPYCDTLCWFCGCNTKIIRRYDPVSSYLPYLHKELDLAANALEHRRPVKHVHWGGGSPTILKAEDAKAIGEKIIQLFDLTGDAEFAVEIDPRDLEADLIPVLAKIGVNRASIGLQDVNPIVQKAINRIQPHEVTESVVTELRRHGIEGINFDLIYGLPHQTTEMVIASVEAALSLNPDRLAIFGYAHVPAMKRHQRMIREEDLPNPEQRFEQQEAAANRLIEAGYVRIGLDHFAVPTDPMAIAHQDGTLRRNFQGYTTDEAEALIGFGASAIGSLPNGYVQNATSVHQYKEALDSDRLPTARGVALSPQDLLRRNIIERLMCDYRVNLDEVCGQHGVEASILKSEWQALNPFEEDHLIRRTGKTIEITEAGWPLVRCVAAVFDQYLSSDGARHSRAV